MRGESAEHSTGPLTCGFVLAPVCARGLFPAALRGLRRPPILGGSRLCTLMAGAEAPTLMRLAATREGAAVILAAVTPAQRRERLLVGELPQVARAEATRPGVAVASHAVRRREGAGLGVDPLPHGGHLCIEHARSKQGTVVGMCLLARAAADGPAIRLAGRHAEIAAKAIDAAALEVAKRPERLAKSVPAGARRALNEIAQAEDAPTPSGPSRALLTCYDFPKPSTGSCFPCSQARRSRAPDSVFRQDIGDSSLKTLATALSRHGRRCALGEVRACPRHAWS
jgi:hypothetical protein